MTTDSVPEEFYKKAAYELGRELARQHQRDELQREIDIDDLIASELSNDPDWRRY